MSTIATEMTFRSVLLSIFLALILATSNAYLALKLGILTSASIPAAILSMGILRFFKQASILENNLVQTAASAGEAIAGGIVYTIPALIMIGYWHHFDYWTNFFIAMSGGTLGVLFSIPLRRIVVHDKNLCFPEGRAIAEVLKSSYAKTSIRPILSGGLIGASIELAQTGFKLLASSWHQWFIVKKTLLGFGFGFSPTMIGAGFLVGRDMTLSIILGALLAYGVALPVVGFFSPEMLSVQTANMAFNALWNTKMRYFGIGGMLFAGIWTLFKLIRPLGRSIATSLKQFTKPTHKLVTHHTEQDIPMPYILMGILIVAIALFVFFHTLFPLRILGINPQHTLSFLLLAVMYVLLVGFLFSVITAYFSGMVGVTASPGSSVVIAGILFAAWLLLMVMQQVATTSPLNTQLKAAEAITIIIGSLVTGIAAIANDNIQDLKVGQLIGATPWKQQLMLLLGVFVSALIIPPVMQLLFDVYGIAGVMPHDHMDLNYSLPAPTAALLAAITEAMFHHTLPWNMMLAGALVVLLVQITHWILGLQRIFHLSMLGIAIGMYLPLSSSVPLFIGGILAHTMEKHLKAKRLSTLISNKKRQIGTLIACGLVAGSALMDVLVAIPCSLMHSSNALMLVNSSFEPYAAGLSIIVLFWLSYWIIRRTR